jgi:hypothetical protein
MTTSRRDHTAPERLPIAVSHAAKIFWPIVLFEPLPRPTAWTEN